MDNKLLDALRECITSPGAPAFRDAGPLAKRRLETISDTARNALALHKASQHAKTFTAARRG